MRRGVLLGGILAGGLVLFGGCRLFDRPEPVRESYNFALRLPSRPPNPTGPILQVAYFESEPQFGTGEFVYRISDFEWQSDFYHHWMDSPATLLTEWTRRWLAGSGQFREVGIPGLLEGASARLQGEILDLSGDFRQPNNPQANLSLRMTLEGTAKHGKPIWTRTFHRKIALTERTPRGLVNAWNLALEEILTETTREAARALAAQKSESKSPPAP